MPATNSDCPLLTRATSDYCQQHKPSCWHPTHCHNGAKLELLALSAVPPDWHVRGRCDAVGYLPRTLPPGDFQNHNHRHLGGASDARFCMGRTAGTERAYMDADSNRSEAGQETK